MHPDLSTLIHLQQNVARHNLPVKAAVGTANQDWDKVQDPSVPIPSAPVYAARLNGLLRSLAAAEGAVADSVKARSELLRELQRLVENASQGLAEDTQTLSVLSKRKAETEDKRREVEHAIMRTLPGQEAAGDIKDGASNSPAPEPERPEVEELTPPPDNMVSRHETDVPRSPPPQETTLPARVPEPEQHAASGIEMLSNLASQYQSLPVSTNGSNKRRRVNSDEFPDLGADDGIDADVAEMLRRDGDAG
jgi:regulator of Ty1 transposition protein 103